MALWENAIITAKGQALQAKLADGHTLSLVRAVASSGYADPEDLPYLTEITDALMDLTFSTLVYPEEGKFGIPVRLSNSGVREECTVNQIWIMAFDPDEGEIPYLIAQATEGTDVPAENDAPGFSSMWTFYVQYEQAEDITITVSPSNTISFHEVQDMIAEHNTEKAPHSNVLATKEELSEHSNRQDNPHNVTAAQLGLGSVNNTPDSEKNVAFASEAASARKVAYNLIIRLKGGRTEGTDMWTYDGSVSKSINITAANIGGAEKEHIQDMKHGGTGATGGSAGLANLLGDGPMILSAHQFGDTLPEPGTPGRIFFKKLPQ